MTSLEFIKKNAVCYTSFIPEELCDKLIKEWNYINYNEVYKLLYSIIPKKCDGEDYVGPGNIEIMSISPDPFIRKRRKRYEPAYYDDKGNESLCTLYLYCNSINYYNDGKTLFYANPKKNINFSVSNAVTYNIPCQAGTVVIFTNSIGYEHIPITSGVKWLLKIKLFYTSNKHKLDEKENNKKVRFS